MNKIQYLPTKASKVMCFLLFGWLLCLYVLENSSIIKLVDFFVWYNILKPTLWIGTIIVVLRLPWTRSKAKLKQISSINGWSFIFAFIFIAASVMLGIYVDGLGKSPYSHSILGMMSNILVVGSALIGRELIRNYLVNSMTKNENYIILTFIALFMTLTGTSFGSITRLVGYENVIKYVAQNIVPDFSQNLFATYLAFLGGPIPSIIYLGVIQAFNWLSPILPNLQWLTAALVGIMCPVFFLSIMQSIHLKESKQLKAKDKDQESALSWIITSILSIGIIWFAVGVFPIFPSVIATGSMEPMIMPGDVIMVKKIIDLEGISRLKVGDVMQFKRGSILITHRIVEITEIEKVGIRYRTKGDNNSVADAELVKSEDIKGTIVYVVPKIGWPTLLIKSKQDVPLQEVFF